MLTDNSNTIKNPIILPVNDHSLSLTDQHDGTPIINQSGLPQTSTELSRWSWKRALLGALAGLLTGGLAGAVIGAVTAGLSDKAPVALPAGEFEAVTAWFKDQFTPQLNVITGSLNALLANNFSAASLPQLNEISKRLCILKNYYQNVNADTFLSQEGIEFRYSLIEPYCNVLENLIREKAASVGAIESAVSVNANAITIEILPQPQTGTVACSVYAVGKDGSIKTTTTSNPTPTPTPTTTQTATNKKHPLLWVALAALGAAFLIPGETKKSKN